MRSFSKIARRCAILIVWLFMVVGCSSKNQAPDPGLESTSPPLDTPTPEIEALPPAPLSLVDLVSQGVDEGQWNKGEGLVAALKLVIGEAGIPGFVDAPAGIDFHSGWALSNLANLYLDSDVDESLKAEIERLLDILAPTDERLAYYAVPAGTSNSKVPGLAALRNFDVNCLDLWATGFRDTLTAPPVCLEYTESLTYNGDYRARAYYPIEKASDDRMMSAVREALEAVEAAIRVYNDLGLEAKSINLIFTQLNLDAITFAQVPNRETLDVRIAPCPLQVFPLGVVMENREQFKQVIAHEVFHCFQYWRYGTLNIEVVEWWAEGSAVYASDLVFPAANQEFAYIAFFDEKAQTDRLTSMSYESFLFFMYYGREHGDSEVIGVMDKFTNAKGGAGTESSEANQYRAFANRLSEPQELFHDFGKAYLDHRIVDSGGTVIPVSPEPGYVLHYPSRGEPYPSAIPFTLTNYLLLFEDEQEYTIDISTEGPPGRSSVRPSEAGDEWGRMPEEVRSSCGVAQFKLLITSTDPASVGSDDEHTLLLDVEAEESLACDDCLVGHWVMSVEPLTSYVAYIIANKADEDVDFLDLSGVFHLDFTPEGQVGITLEDYKLHWIYHEEGFDIDVVQEFIGVSWAKYGATDDDRLRAWDEVSAFLLNTTTTAMGVVNTTSSPYEEEDAIFLLSNLNNPYVCSETTLTISAPALDPPVEYVYTRTSNTPLSFPPDPEGDSGP